MKYIGFTGHRHIRKRDSEWAHDSLNDAVERAAKSGAIRFVSGGAPYWDWWFLEAAMLQRWYRAGRPDVGFDAMYSVDGWDNDLIVIAALPFPGFWDHYANKKDADRIYIKNLHDQLDLIVHVDDQPEYKAWKMHARNKWIVDNSDAIITVYDGRDSGGTFETLKYARKKKKPILWLDPTKRKQRWIGV